MSSIKKTFAVFLDRDGTISSDEYGYISNPDEYKIYPYTGEALRLLKDAGFLLFVVTNQSGIARGYFDIPTLETVHSRMKELIHNEGVALDAVYFSPYYADGSVEPYNIEHEDRKPGIGMFKRAKAEYVFETHLSWMIGDRYSDIAFGHRAGLKTILLLSGNGKQEFIHKMHAWDIKPDFIANDLLTAARLILQIHQ